MDREIIIGGVNVSRCEDYGYRGEAGYWCHYYDEPCADYPNCCYKQLQRKTAECKKYEQALDEIEKIASGNYETLDPLAKQQISNIITKAKDKEQC